MRGWSWAALRCHATGAAAAADPPPRRPAIRPARVLDPLLDRGPCLLAVASSKEAAAVLAGLGLDADQTPPPWSPATLNPRLAIVVTGVGKANAAGAIAAAAPGAWSAVLSLGIAGALPGPSAPPILAAVLAESCRLADEGLCAPEGFLSQSGLGFPAIEGVGERFETDPAWSAALRPLADAAGPCATVSTCSATDQAAQEIARRTGALCEDMESAAAALAAARLGIPFACLRVVSNRTGDRPRQGWDLPGAFSVLERLAAAL